MAFDKNLDKEIFSETASFETTKIKVDTQIFGKREVFIYKFKE